MARHPNAGANTGSDPRYNKNAIVDRSQFEGQLFDAQGKPTAACYAFAGRMQKEVGGQGPEAQMAFAESVLNRCASRGHRVDYEVRNHAKYSYWPQRQSDPGYSNNKQYIDIIRKVVKNGTNLTCGATGNDGIGDGINTKAPTLYVANGERYSIEAADRNWHRDGFAKLIRGVGKFIGDVAGAIGKVVQGAVRAVGNAITNIFQPHSASPYVHPYVQQNSYPQEQPLAHHVHDPRYARYQPPAGMQHNPAQPGKSPYVNTHSPHPPVRQHEHPPGSWQSYYPRS
jgi:hypothetical protein